ncbi:MAG: putative PEP-binding protein [Cyanobacteria bacterium J06623_7]
MEIYWLSQIQAKERSLVGNKLYVLSQLLQEEHPVLPGFVLSNLWWREFLSLTEIALLFEEGEPDYRQLQTVSQHNRQAIKDTPMPDMWRSQIFRAAQQLNSRELILQPYLSSPFVTINGVDLGKSLTCNCHPVALSMAVKAIWADVLSASSLIYLRKLGLQVGEINLAILIRPLKEAVASGTLALNDKLIRIEATWGLDQSCRQGDVEPDSYYIDRQLGEIVVRHLGHKNYAYRLKPPELDAQACDRLETYLVAESQATAYTLKTEAINQLIRQMQGVLAQYPHLKYATWTAIEYSPTVTQYYFTQLSDRLVSEIVLPTGEFTLGQSPTPELISGIAVSRGIVHAKLVIVPDLKTATESSLAGAILVTKQLEPEQIHLIKQLQGIITETGGKNSHGAIVARELNIPAIVNATNATNILSPGALVLLDGDRGKVYSATQAQPYYPAAKPLLSPTYSIATKLMVNLSQPESIAATSKLAVDGVGLLRSELLLADFLADKTLAQWQDSFQQQFVSTLVAHLRDFAAAFAPRPVFYRSLDLYARNDNSGLGQRGTASYLLDSTLFDLELTALKMAIAEGYNNLNLVLPFIRSVDEFKFCQSRLAHLSLNPGTNLQIWIMAEVPSVIFLLPEYVKAGVQGIAIGTNDLTQLILGVDREQNEFERLGLNANHAAMQRAIEQLIHTAHQQGIACSICGQAPVEYPQVIERLIKWGVDAISVEPAALAQTYKAIARAEKRLLLRDTTQEQ